MAKYLVIVESPAKVKTIQKFLGANYTVAASNGHVRDLPKSSLGIDVENDYEPKYITIRGKGDILAKLRKEVKKADKIYLATDPDREGEAISWHLYYALKLEGKKVYRITFNEITKQAVKDSLKHAREIDMNLVNAQQARRCLDRCVGYRISPLLWAKIKRGLSAGRVQSVALRIICDREEEINAFIPKEYWSAEATLLKEGKKQEFVAKYLSKNNNGTAEDLSIKKEEIDQVLATAKKNKFVVSDIKNSSRNSKAPLPFKTSTLQQEASKQLNFSTVKTMRLAQQLYEGVEVKGAGTVGIITYLRTDSTRVSEEAEASVEEYILKNFGKEFLAGRKEEKKSGTKIQDAHEAIRPTDVTRTPVAIKESLSRDQFRLYQLIWRRFVASRMANAVYDITSVKCNCGDYLFGASASHLSFEGYMNVYVDAEEDKKTKNAVLGSLKVGEELSLQNIEAKQHFTQPPAHFTEASLVKTLEDKGIGRPSTYAPTISTIMARHYIVKEGKNLYVTEIGEKVNEVMVKNFPSIVDVEFTANMEILLDAVEAGEVDWKTTIRNFYPDLDEAVKIAEKQQEAIEIKYEESDELCDNCHEPLLIKFGPYGRFLACRNFPECKCTKPYYEKIGVPCPKCGKDIVLKKSKKGRKYYGCIDQPNCDFMVWQKPSKEKCPKCGSLLLEKGSNLLCMNKDCGFIMPNKEKQS